ncbi:MAG TPA: hypothetical protein VF056_03285 [Thermoleophilaceae bacterium]
MIRYRLIPALIACVALLAIATAAGAERGSSSAMPKRVVKQIDQAKRATARFKDVAEAEAAGYTATEECVTTGKGGMGFHYVNVALIADPKLDHRKPETCCTSRRTARRSWWRSSTWCSTPGRRRRRASSARSSRER